MRQIDIISVTLTNRLFLILLVFIFSKLLPLWSVDSFDKFGTRIDISFSILAGWRFLIGICLMWYIAWLIFPIWLLISCLVYNIDIFFFDDNMGFAGISVEKHCQLALKLLHFLFLLFIYIGALLMLWIFHWIQNWQRYSFTA